MRVVKKQKEGAKKALFHYSGGVGRDSDCAPDSAGNRRNPAGRDAAAGRTGGKPRNKMEKGVLMKKGECCEDEAAFFEFLEMRRGQQHATTGFYYTARNLPVCLIRSQHQRFPLCACPTLLS